MKIKNKKRKSIYYFGIIASLAIISSSALALVSCASSSSTNNQDNNKQEDESNNQNKNDNSSSDNKNDNTTQDETYHDETYEQFKNQTSSSNDTLTSTGFFNVVKAMQLNALSLISLPTSETLNTTLQKIYPNLSVKISSASFSTNTMSLELSGNVDLEQNGVSHTYTIPSNTTITISNFYDFSQNKTYSLSVNATNDINWSVYFGDGTNANTNVQTWTLTNWLNFYQDGLVFSINNEQIPLNNINNVLVNPKVTYLSKSNTYVITASLDSYDYDASQNAWTKNLSSSINLTFNNLTFPTVTSVIKATYLYNTLIKNNNNSNKLDLSSTFSSYFPSYYVFKDKDANGGSDAQITTGSSYINTLLSSMDSANEFFANFCQTFFSRNQKVHWSINNINELNANDINGTLTISANLFSGDQVLVPNKFTFVITGFKTWSTLQNKSTDNTINVLDSKNSINSYSTYIYKQIKALSSFQTSGTFSFSASNMYLLPNYLTKSATYSFYSGNWSSSNTLANYNSLSSIYLFGSEIYNASQAVSDNSLNDLVQYGYVIDNNIAFSSVYCSIASNEQATASYSGSNNSILSIHIPLQFNFEFYDNQLATADGTLNFTIFVK